jgi:protein phosphatase
VYRVTPREVIRLTRDHSWAEGVVSHGLMSAEDAARDPRAHMITRWLGPPDQEDPGLETFRFRLASGDVVLCCTDGLYMYFSPPVSAEEEMQRILWAHEGDLQAGVDELVDMALQRGGRDNITVAAIQAVAVEDGQEPETEQVAARDSTPVDQTIRLPTMLMRDAEAEE